MHINAYIFIPLHPLCSIFTHKIHCIAYRIIRLRILQIHTHFSHQKIHAEFERMHSRRRRKMIKRKKEIKEQRTERRWNKMGRERTN